jgi:hypothetical protein
MCGRGSDELGHLFGKPIFTGLHIEAQEKGTEFHYAWLLILIVLVRWKEPGYYQCMCTSGSNNLAVRYANLWHTTIKRRQNDSNATFFVYLENITYLVGHTPCISTEIVATYKDIT